MRRTSLACISIVACLGWSLPAWGADDTPTPAAAANDAPAADSLPVTIKLASTKIQAEAIRAAIETELKVAVRIEDLAVNQGLSVSVRWRRVTVSYRSEKGETTTRSLDLPANTEQAVEVIALLAGNLARDQASELLARLAPPPSETAPAEPATTPETPPPAPETKAEAPKPAAEPAKVEKKPAPKPAGAKPRDPLIRENFVVANGSLFYPVTALKETERRLVNVEVGAGYSRIGRIEGGAFTLGHLRIERGARGAVGTLGWTRVDGEMYGAQGGLLVSEGYGGLHGIDFGLFVAFRDGDIEGAQGSALVASANDVLGAQGAAGFVWADDVVGAQGALVTLARDVKGGQLGLVDVARDIDGGQLGLVNVARTTDFQFGLVNVAKRVDVASIGLVNIAGNGYIEPTAYFISDVSGTGRSSYNAGVKFVAGLAYSQFAVGFGNSQGTDTTSPGKQNLRTEAGVGLHVEPLKHGAVVDRLALEVGGHVSSMPTIDESAMHYRLGLGFRFFRTLWLLGGYDVSHDLVHYGDNVGHGPWGGIAVF